MKNSYSISYYDCEQKDDNYSNFVEMNTKKKKIILIWYECVQKKF